MAACTTSNYNFSKTLLEIPCVHVFELIINSSIMYDNKLDKKVQYFICTHNETKSKLISIGILPNLKYFFISMWFLGLQ